MRATVALLLIGAAGRVFGATYPPCGPTLQACIDAAAPGDTVQVATDGPIDEDVTIRKTLVLTNAPGFTPVIGTGVTHRTVAIQDAGPGNGTVQITLSNLTLNNGELGITLDDDGAHTILVSGCRISHGTGGTMATGIAVSVAVPSMVTLRNNVVNAPGDVVKLSTSLASGSATLTVLGNRLGTFNPSTSVEGILVGLGGAGTVSVNLYSNVIGGVSFSSGGAGIDVMSVNFGGTGAVNIINNTLDDIQGSTSGTSSGIQIKSPNATEQLSVNIFNNVITRATRRGIEILQSPAVPSLMVANGFNDSYGNALADNFGGYPMGPVTIAVDPRYVDASVANYHLQPGSPLIDAGSSSPVGGLPSVDADDDLRVAGTLPDIGAYEFGSVPAGTTTTTSTTTTLPRGCAVAATFASIACRLDGLEAAVQAGARPGRLADRLVTAARRAKTRARQAEQASTPAKMKGALTRAIRAMTRFDQLLRSRRIPRELRTSLRATVSQLRADLRALRPR